MIKKYYFNYLIVFILGFLLAVWLFAGQVELEKYRLNELETGKVVKGSSNMVAVTNNGNGLIGKVNVDVYDGDGKILINTNPFLEPDTQYSANIATAVAQNVTGTSLKNKNVVFDFDMGGNVSVVGGPSAGAAMTIALIGAIEGKEVDKNKVVTGAILPDGSIGWVGSIIEKGEAVKENNVKEFLIPKGQTNFRYYEKETSKQTKNGITIYRTRYVPKEVNIFDYFNNEISIKEVKNINEVKDLILEK